jgi:hypothetical protein
MNNNPCKLGNLDRPADSQTEDVSLHITVDFRRKWGFHLYAIWRDCTEVRKDDPGGPSRYQCAHRECQLF